MYAAAMSLFTNILSMGFLYNLLLFACVFGPVVLFHELGHYFFARRFNVGVSEFAVGFGQKIMTFNDKRGTQWSIRLLPLGGFIRVIEDKDQVQEFDRVIVGEAIHQKPYYQRMLIFFGGPAANFIMVFVLVTGLVMWKGMPFYEPIIGKVTNIENSSNPDNISNKTLDEKSDTSKFAPQAATQSSLQAGDKVLSVDGQEVSTWREVTLNLIGKTKANFKVERGDETCKETKDIELVAKVVPGKVRNSYEWGMEGKEPVYSSHNFFGSMWQAILYIIAGLAEFIGLLKLIATKGVSFLSGPVGMFKNVGAMAAKGMEATLWYMVKISMGLGLFNLLPLPLLDGGRMFVASIEKLIGRNLSDRAMNYWGYIGLMLIVSLFGSVTFFDLLKK